MALHTILNVIVGILPHEAPRRSPLETGRKASQYPTISIRELGSSVLLERPVRAGIGRIEDGERGRCRRSVGGGGGDGMVAENDPLRGGRGSVREGRKLSYRRDVFRVLIEESGLGRLRACKIVVGSRTSR